MKKSSMNIKIFAVFAGYVGGPTMSVIALNVCQCSCC